jgi:signal transduction histidine kinase
MVSGESRAAAQPRGDAAWLGLLSALVEASTESVTESLYSLLTSACGVVRCSSIVLTLFDERGKPEHRIVAGTEAPPADLAGPAESAIRSTGMLGLPVRIGDTATGMLHVFRSPDEDDFDDDDEQLLRLVLRAIASLVSRARALRSSEHRQRWLTESADVTRELLSGKHDDPLRLVIERVWEIADADLIVVATERPEPDTYSVIEAAGPYAEAVQGRTLHAGATFAGQVIMAGVPRVVSDLDTDYGRAELAAIAGAKTAVFVPLQAAGSERGVLVLFRRADRPEFSSADLEAATTFAAQVSLALQLADTRTQWEHGVLLDERGRIARDLHDHVIQRLFAIGLTVNSVSTSLESESQQRLLEGVDALDDTISQIRSTIYRLTGPIVSTENSIRNRVLRLVSEMESVLGFAPELEFKGPVDFGVNDEITGDCIAVLREALTNVARHARASRVHVSVAASSSDLTLDVVDDGAGIGTVSRRSGLANMRTRAERRGGNLIVASAVPHGTRLSWTVPIKEGDHPLHSAAQ